MIVNGFARKNSEIGIYFKYFFQIKYITLFLTTQRLEGLILLSLVEPILGFEALFIRQ